jgi:hypothetical protein
MRSIMPDVGMQQHTFHNLHMLPCRLLDTHQVLLKLHWWGIMLPSYSMVFLSHTFLLSVTVIFYHKIIIDFFTHGFALFIKNRA